MNEALPPWARALAPEHQGLLRPARPAWAPPMLGKLVRTAPPGAWVCERKLDGYRTMVVRRQGGPFTVHARNGGDVTGRHADLFEDLPDRDLVLDGELVAMHEGREDFAAVQQGQATHFVAFDVLHLDGFDVRALPLRQRRDVLRALELRGALAVVASIEDEPSRLHARACEEGWEGLMVKDPRAPYVSGRSEAWRKLKCQRVGVFTILGYTKGDHGIAALHVGRSEDGAMQYAGKVGTGFSHAEAARLHDRLARRRVDRPPVPDAPDGAWVRPDLACRVAYTERTSTGRLRHPRYVQEVDAAEAGA